MRRPTTFDQSRIQLETGLPMGTPVGVTSCAILLALYHRETTPIKWKGGSSPFHAGNVPPFAKSLETIEAIGWTVKYDSLAFFPFFRRVLHA